MVFSQLAQRPTLTFSLIGAIATTSLLVANPVQAASFVDFTPASSRIGDVTNFTASGDADLSSNGNNFADDVATFVGLDPNNFPLNNPAGFTNNPEDTAFQGSAVKFNVNAGDTISFNWNFLLGIEPSDPTRPEKDYAFFVFNGSRTILADSANGSGTGSFTANNAGLFSIGLVDLGDVLGTSTLNLQDVQVTPIPTPALLPGLIGLGVATVRRRKTQAKKAA
jgi:hypothetical protein